jgi:glycyl-tRNA synthetase beta chain
MVTEFPELQGIMGAHYAHHDGEPDAICQAIRFHYTPAFAGDRIPPGKTAQIVAISDRIDTLVGIFASGLKPTGNKDPFALRRAALGLVRILLEGQLNVSLERCLAMAANELSKQLEVSPQTLEEVQDFIRERIRHHYLDAGYPAKMVNAVMAAPLNTLPDFDSRLSELHRFMQRSEALSLAGANKRIGNILRKSSHDASSEIDTDLFVLDEEEVLFDEVINSESTLLPLYQSGDYGAVLQHLSGLREMVDTFFDKVMVMDDDPGIRTNRLNLLRRLKGLFDRVADFALIG